MEREPFVSHINGRHSLLKPPLSARLRSGSVVLNPGESIGEHKTENREEAIIILKGNAVITCEGERFAIGEKQFAYIPPECIHNVSNESDSILEYVYIVTTIDDSKAKEHSHGGMSHSH